MEKIRCLSLVQQQVLQGASRLPLDNSATLNCVPEKTADIENFLSYVSEHDLSETEMVHCISHQWQGCGIGVGVFRKESELDC